MVIPHMIKVGGGTVIIVSSVAGLIGSAKLGTYGLSKAADVALARNIAVEWGGENIRANCFKSCHYQNRLRPRSLGKP
ncbi:MAG: hypothetical protein CM1200mP4_4220 [Rhodospirillaceae bacterium]|nr:MAG: hypothetical protein CM1200mP4_4220 [Rhodospirillaceae bacterium]